MTGIIVVTHSNMAKGLKDAVEMIVGEQECFFSVGYYVGDSLDDLNSNLINIIDNNKCNKWIIFTDMFGDTPSNVSAVITTQKNATVVTGVNLGMVLETLSKRDSHDTDKALEEIINVGKSDIRIITEDMVMQNIKE